MVRGTAPALVAGPKDSSRRAFHSQVDDLARAKSDRGGNGSGPESSGPTDRYVVASALAIPKTVPSRPKGAMTLD